MAPTIVGPVREKEAGFLVEDFLKAKAQAPPGTTIVVSLPPSAASQFMHPIIIEEETRFNEGVEWGLIIKRLHLQESHQILYPMTQQLLLSL